MSTPTYGNFTRKLLLIWSERAETRDKMGSQVVPQTFRDMDMYPSSSQVHEMLQCANECSNRPDGDYLTFGEFCVYASELKSSYNNKIPRPTPLSKPLAKPESRRLIRRRSSPARKSKHQVFLGGSCNPTTWRKDIAIPYFKSLRIDYYNPQVVQWGPELIELENQAKQNAEVMFFVIDNQTRSVASMIEAAQVAGSRRKLVLVVHPFERAGCVVMGEPISEREFRELRRGQRHLRDCAEREGLPVFDSIGRAAQGTAALLRGEDLREAAARMGHVQIGDSLLKLREVFNGLDSEGCGRISLTDVCMAFKVLTSAELSVESLKSVISEEKGFPPSAFDNYMVNFNQFCCIVTEFKNQMESASTNLPSLKNKATDILASVLTPFSKLFDWICPESSKEESNGNGIAYAVTCRDVYLGGTGKPSTWREDIAVPLLKKHAFTYFIPQEGAWSDHFIPMEAANMENSRVLLFVIKNDARSLADMILAAHYVGIGCRIVLCIQYIEDGAVIEGEKLSCQAVKDYNRGRVYLSDLATRAGVPVFDDIKEAVECVAKLCKQNS